MIVQSQNCIMGGLIMKSKLPFIGSFILNGCVKINDLKHNDLKLNYEQHIVSELEYVCNDRNHETPISYTEHYQSPYSENVEYKIDSTIYPNQLGLRLVELVVFEGKKRVISPLDTITEWNKVSHTFEYCE